MAGARVVENLDADCARLDVNDSLVELLLLAPGVGEVVRPS
jgi:hypothetical protein